MTVYLMIDNLVMYEEYGQVLFLWWDREFTSWCKTFQTLGTSKCLLKT